MRNTVLSFGLLLLFTASLQAQYGTFDFATDTQGWTRTGPFDENGGGPYYECLSFRQTGSGRLGPDGSLFMLNTGDFCGNSAYTYWIYHLYSPDLTSSPTWQSANGYSVYLYQILQIWSPEVKHLWCNLYVTVYDNIQGKNRYFYNGTAVAVPYNQWTRFEFANWSAISGFPTSYVVKQVFINLWGLAAENYNCCATEGPNPSIQVDDVVPDYVTPVQLSSFAALPIANGGARLDWTTLSETNNYGFEIEREGTGEDNFAALPGAFIPGHGTTVEVHKYSYLDQTATTGKWTYRLKQIDLNGKFNYSEPATVNVVTSVSMKEMPSTFVLGQNYPNPFNPSTTIRYGLPYKSTIQLRVFNTLGQQVALLQNGEQEAGYHEVEFDGSGLSSGVYFYRMQVRPSDSAVGRDSKSGAGDFVQTRQLLLLR